MSEEKQGLSVAIIGAGIAGLSLAIGLHKQGIPFTLYEEAAQHSVVGAGIGFGPNGLGAMDLLEERFRPKYEAICVGNKLPKDQNVFFEGLLCTEGLGLEESWYGHSSWGAPKYTRKSAHRRELLDIMTGFIPPDSVKFSKKLTGIRQQEDGVILSFSDGENAWASALAGADGILSIVRRHVLEQQYPDQIDPIYAHSYAYRAVIPISEAEEILGKLTDTAKTYIGEERNVVTYRVSGGTEFNFLHCVFTPDKAWGRPGAVTEAVSHEEMMADFEGRGIDERLIKLLEKARPVRWALFHHLYTSTYFKDRVVLLGDSAHASLPYQAAGAGQGVEDALILSSVLGYVAASTIKLDLAAKIQAAFKAYDAIRRPRAQKQTEQSLEAARLLSFQDPKAGADMEKTLQRLQGQRFDWLWFHDLSKDVQLAQEKMESIMKG